MTGNVFASAGKKTTTTRMADLKKTKAFSGPTVMHAARVPEKLSKAIKKLAIDEETSMQALTIEALETLLKLRGQIPDVDE